MKIDEEKYKDDTWDDIFRKARLSKIPFPSKLSLEFYEKLKLNLPHPAKILEAGSGTGEMSAYLAKKNYDVYLLDKSDMALEFSKKFFHRYNISGTFVKGDLFSIPFPNDSFDCVWNSGVLEHFDDKKIVNVLKEMARVSKNLVITLVPNARNVIYRIAKWRLEDQNKWPYGDEFPKYTMYPYFKEANLYTIEENFIGAYAGAMWFNKIVKTTNIFINELTSWVESLREELLLPGVSYLILTVGKKNVYKKNSENLVSNLEKQYLSNANLIPTLHHKVITLEKELSIYRRSKFWKLYRFLKKIKDKHSKLR